MILISVTKDKSYWAITEVTMALATFTSMWIKNYVNHMWRNRLLLRCGLLQ